MLPGRYVMSPEVGSIGNPCRIRRLEIPYDTYAHRSGVSLYCHVCQAMLPRDAITFTVPEFENVLECIHRDLQKPTPELNQHLLDDSCFRFCSTFCLRLALHFWTHALDCRFCPVVRRFEDVLVYDLHEFLEPGCRPFVACADCVEQNMVSLNAHDQGPRVQSLLREAEKMRRHLDPKLDLLSNESASRRLLGLAFLSPAAPMFTVSVVLQDGRAPPRNGLPTPSCSPTRDVDR